VRYCDGPWRSAPSPQFTGKKCTEQNTSCGTDDMCTGPFSLVAGSGYII